MAYSQYKVIEIAEGGCGTLLLGAATIPTRKLEQRLNEEAANGWRVVFQIIEKQRFLLFWTRERVLVTLGQ